MYMHILYIVFELKMGFIFIQSIYQISSILEMADKLSMPRLDRLTSSLWMVTAICTSSIAVITSFERFIVQLEL